MHTFLKQNINFQHLIMHSVKIYIHFVVFVRCSLFFILPPFAGSLLPFFSDKQKADVITVNIAHGIYCWKTGKLSWLSSNMGGTSHTYISNKVGRRRMGKYVKLMEAQASVHTWFVILSLPLSARKHFLATSCNLKLPKRQTCVPSVPSCVQDVCSTASSLV